MHKQAQPAPSDTLAYAKRQILLADRLLELRRAGVIENLRIDEGCVTIQLAGVWFRPTRAALREMIHTRAAPNPPPRKTLVPRPKRPAWPSAQVAIPQEQRRAEYLRETGRVE